jgi:hypothetical protein
MFTDRQMGITTLKLLHRAMYVPRKSQVVSHQSTLLSLDNPGCKLLSFHCFKMSLHCFSILVVRFQDQLRMNPPTSVEVFGM